MPTISGMRRRGFTPEAIRALRRRGRRRQARERHRRRPARALRPRGSERARPARDGRAAAAQGRHRELPRRPRSRRWTPSTTPRTRRPARARCRSRACSTSSRTTSARIRRRSSSGSRRAARCGCATRTSSPAARSSRTPRAQVVELRCTYDPATRGGDAPDGRKVKATIHWVSAAHAIDAEVRLYDRLFTVEDPGAGDADFLDAAQPARRSRSFAAASSSRRSPRARRRRASSSSGWATSASIPIRAPGAPVFNRTVTLRDTLGEDRGGRPSRLETRKARWSLLHRAFRLTSVFRRSRVHAFTRSRAGLILGIIEILTQPLAWRPGP